MNSDVPSRPRLINVRRICSIATSVVFIFALLAWPASYIFPYTPGHHATYDNGRVARYAYFHDGYLGFVRYVSDMDGKQPQSHAPRIQLPGLTLNTSGIGSGTFGPGFVSTALFIHFAYLLGFSGAGWLLMKRLAARRAVDGRVCIACGYDMRATPDRCPECGTVPVRAAVKVMSR